MTANKITDVMTARAQGVDYSKVCWTRRVKFHDAPAALAQVCKDWQETGADLLTAQGSVALILWDVAQALGLDEDELREAFGAALRERLAAL